MSQQVLDDVFQSESEITLVQASKGKRFANLLIDYVGIIVFFLLVSMLIGVLDSLDEDSPVFNLLIYLLYVTYYFLFEYFTKGKSLGKYVTGTRVVTTEGNLPSAGAFLGRSFARLIPFEVLSFFGSEPNGWHDRLPGTIVIDEKQSRLPYQGSELV